MTGTSGSARPSRVLRGAAAASLATFTATLLHVSAGGNTPSEATLGLTLAFATLACVALAGRRSAPWRTAVSVGLSQVLYHLLFSLDAGAALPRTLTPAHGHATMAGMPAMAAIPGPVAPPMWAAHLAAALITVAGILWGEQLLRVLARLPRGVRRWLGRLVPTTPTDRPRLVAPPVLGRAALPLEAPALRSWSRRGPPLLSF